MDSHYLYEPCRCNVARSATPDRFTRHRARSARFHQLFTVADSPPYVSFPPLFWRVFPRIQVSTRIAPALGMERPAHNFIHLTVGTGFSRRKSLARCAPSIGCGT